LDLRILYFSLFGEKDKIKIVVFNFEGGELNHSSVCLEKGPVWMVGWRNVPVDIAADTTRTEAFCASN
jgi:hypothetical protein